MGANMCLSMQKLVIFAQCGEQNENLLCGETKK